MSIKELAQNIGKEGTILLSNMRVSVRILDVKQAYGNTRYLVTPLEGIGQTWVDERKVLVMDNTFGVKF